MRKVVLLMAAVFLFCGSSCAAGVDDGEIEDAPQTDIQTTAVVSPGPTVTYQPSLENTSQEQETTPEPTSVPWTEEEAIALAQMLWGECRGVKSVTEQAACVWCVLNRCDAYGKPVMEVLSAPQQFQGYSPNNPVWDELVALSEDVLARWYQEKDGVVDVGRVLPEDYLWFSGDGERNHFRNAYKDGVIWNWSLPSPYES